MISLSTIEPGTYSTVVLYEAPESDLLALAPRVTRSVTLDGGAVLTHGGFSHGDRTLTIAATIDEDQAAALRYMATEETLLYLAAADGFYSGMIQDLAIDNGDLRLRFLVKERLDD